MAEIPTPHSLAIGTLIALFSDPNSPLIHYFNDDDDHDGPFHDDDAVNRGRRHKDDNANACGSGSDGMSTDEWTLKLSKLIQHLVMKEDEGVVLLDDGDNAKGMNCAIGARRPELQEEEEGKWNEREERDDDHDDFFKRNFQGLDDLDIDLDFNVIFNDTLDSIAKSRKQEGFLRNEGDDPASSSPSSPSPSVSGESPQTQQQQPPTTQIAPKTNTISTTIPTRMAYTTSSQWYLQIESLTNLLDRIDDAFLSPLPTSTSDSNQLHPNHHRTQMRTRNQRNPPTKAFFSRLKLASTSIDHLVDLLDEWHALLNGVYCGCGVGGVGQGLGGTSNLISIDGESAFGAYLRKLCLGLEELPFEGLSNLWLGLKQYVEEMEEEEEEGKRGEKFKLGNECHRLEENEMEEEAAIPDSGVDDGATLPSVRHEWMPSSQQVERIVRNTCLLPDLESKLRHSSSSRRLQGLIPCYLHDDDASTKKTETNSYATSSRQRHCYNLQQTHPECPSLHFLDFLSSLANGQRSRALESLHRYFDYAMIHERKERAERAMLMLQSAGGGGNTGSGDALGGITGMGGPTASAGSGTTAVDRMAGQRGGASSASGSLPGKFQDSNVMQYVAILLAQMYHRFGYSRLSLQATEEAMRVAQQSGDDECVSFAMGWLALVSSSATASSAGDGGGAGCIEAGSISGRSTSIYALLGGLPFSGHDMSSRLFRPVAYASTNSGMRMNANGHEALLRRCQRRAADRGLSTLTAGVSLELARRTTFRRYAGGLEIGDIDEDGTFGTSSMAWGNIQIAGRTLAPGSSSAGLGASGIQSRGLLGASAAGGGAAVAGGSIANPLEGGEAPSDIITMNGSKTLSILGKRIMMTSGLWDSTGHTSLASLSSCAALYGFGSKLGEDESSLATRRMLSSYFYGPGMDVWRIGCADESSSNVYASTLLHLAKSSDTKKSPSTGWIQTSSTILHEWCVRSYDFSMARSLQCLLNNHAALPSGALMPAIEASLASLTRSTHLSIQQRDYERAKTSARRACWLASHHGLLFQQAWQLLQLALIDLESSSCAPQSTIERAIPPLLECLSLCEDYFMDPLRAVALSALAKVHLGMGRFRKARSMLNAAMPLVMQHGHLWLQSEACLTLAKCHLAEASWIEGGKPGDLISDRKGILSTTDSGHAIDIMNLRQTALFQLEKSASILEQLDEISRLREVYYLQARVYQSLPHINRNLRKRDEAARKFAQLGIEKQRRISSKVMSIPRFSTESTDSGWWDVIQGVLPTDCDGLRRVVLLKEQRSQQR